MKCMMNFMEVLLVSKYHIEEENIEIAFEKIIQNPDYAIVRWSNILNSWIHYSYCVEDEHLEITIVSFSNNKIDKMQYKYN